MDVRDFNEFFRFVVRGKKSGFSVLPIYPTKAPVQSIKLKKEFGFFGSQKFALVTSCTGEPGEGILRCDIYKVEKDGYIILQKNEGY